MLKASFAQHPYSKKKRSSRNYKVKNVQVEDEIIDIKRLVNFPMLLSLCEGGQGFFPPLCDKFHLQVSEGATMEPSMGQPRPHRRTFHLLAKKTICLTFYKYRDDSYQLDGFKIGVLECLWCVLLGSKEGKVNRRIAYRLSGKQLIIFHSSLFLCIVFLVNYEQQSWVRIPPGARIFSSSSPKRPEPLWGQNVLSDG